MRDGAILLGDVYRPVDSLEAGAAVPGVVTRTPYDKELSGAGLVAVMPNALKMAERGYAVLVCDTRGRYASEGDFNPFHQEGPDGYDTIEWLAAQPWCDGTTAIYGPSYVGATTMLGAREAPPSLRCAIPIITSDDYYDGLDLSRAGRFSSASWACGARDWRRRATCSMSTSIRRMRCRRCRTDCWATGSATSATDR